ncbi:MAG: hypothetical protein ACJ71T_01355 [Actinomycetales bacterium]
MEYSDDRGPRDYRPLLRRLPQRDFRGRWRSSVIRTLASAALVAVALPFAAAAPAFAQRSDIERGTVEDTFDDELYLDLCGITTTTTVTERWSLKTYPDGSQVFHDVRTFRSADPRLPVEKGAATAFYAADGSWRVVGKPIQLIAPDGGTVLLDAGWISFDADGDVSTVRGPHPSVGVDLSDYYCPE